MSNNEKSSVTTPTGVVITSERFATPSNPFTVDSMKVGKVETAAFTVDGREAEQQHVSIRMFDVESVNMVGQFNSSTGETNVGISLTVGGRLVDLTLWGITLDMLSSAIDTARLATWGQ